MKEAPNSPYNKLVFRETFSDEQSVRRNGGVPTNLTFEKGLAKFDASIVKHIRYNAIFRGTYSIRVKIKGLAYNSSNTYFIDSIGATFNLRMSNAGIVLTSFGTVYVNGVATTTVIAGDNEILVSGITMAPDTLVFGTFRNLASQTSNIIGDVELFEIYEGVLTPSEVKNLYRNSWAKDDIKKDLLLDYDSTNGYITDRTGKNTLTATDVSIKKTGGFYSSEFNGSTSKIDTGSDFIGTKAVTICGWIKAYSYGKGNYGRIVDNGKLFFLVDGVSKSLRFSSNAALEVISAANSILLRKWYFVVAIRNAGLAAFYIGNKTSAPVVSGENLNSGAPISGINNVLIGDNAIGLRTFYGNITNVKVYEGILSLEELTQIWSNTRDKVS